MAAVIKDDTELRPPAASTAVVVPIDPPTTTRDIQNINEAIEESKITETKVEPAEAPKKPEAGLGNYFRVFRYGTKLDAFLMGMSMLASIGAGVAMPLMNVVFGMFSV
jgi:ATP-binding cassette subfamily B (MDR/TAP) protein 1